MYLDIDSILFDSTARPADNGARRWVSRIDATVLSAEELCLLYGCWAEDAAASGLINPLQSARPGMEAYAA